MSCPSLALLLAGVLAYCPPPAWPDQACPEDSGFLTEGMDVAMAGDYLAEDYLAEDVAEDYLSASQSRPKLSNPRPPPLFWPSQ